MKKVGLVLCALIVAVSIPACDPDDKDNYDANYNIQDFQEETKDWMKDQADGKDYTTDDGGEYYCMGKNDTCPNKTKNAYDLFCSACDPDGDNIEG